MDRLALVADLHGNYQATLAMEAELKALGVDEILCLGDAVGKGPDSDKTCDWVRASCTTVIGGNWDYGIGGKEFPDDEFFWRQLGEERMRWLNGLPREGELLLSGVRFHLFHGRPVSPLMRVTSPELAEYFRLGDTVYGGIIFADSHRPFIRTLNEGYAINTGSVGNSMGVPKAHGLLLEGTKGSEAPSSLRMTVLSVPYDNRAAVAAVPEGLPRREAYIREITTGIYSR